MKTVRSLSYSGHENPNILEIGDRTESRISADVIHPRHSLNIQKSVKSPPGRPDPNTKNDNQM